MTSPAEPGGIVSRAVILNAKLSVHARLLYAALAVQADDARECARSRAELIEDSGIPETSIKRAMRELLTEGIVEIYAAKTERGGYSTNVYRLNDNPWAGVAQPPSGSVPVAQGLGPSGPRVDGSAAQTLGPVWPKGLGQGDPRGLGPEGPKGLIYKKDRYSSSENSLTTSSTHTTEEYKRAKPDPAPEEVPVALLNLNDFDDLPTGPAKLPRQRKSTPTDDPDFDKAWAAYSHKVDRVQAKKAWARAVKKAPAETILAAIPAYVAVTTGKGEPEGTGTAWKPRRKNLATWLNNEGWTEEIEPPKKGYQGQAGSDLGPAESYENAAKHLPIHRLARLGPMGNDWEMNFAWYYHWNVQEQRGWTVEQMLETGNTPEDVDALMDAYANGIDPQLYQRLLSDYNIPPHGSDA
jgi:hypothetical protein